MYKVREYIKNNIYMHMIYSYTNGYAFIDVMILRCPRAFHSGCIPPGSRYNEWAVLCNNHPDDILPTKVSIIYYILSMYLEINNN
jgi:hypothetical protein